MISKMFPRVIALLVLAVCAMFAVATTQTTQVPKTRGNINDQQLAQSLGIDRQVLYEDLVAIQDDVSRLQAEF
ncbi:hypothetical protein Ocin01_04510 [Orchesella cincta]|uniref:Uncharacterized protein n=1 Tax=Orchesella cincta TaxID=48709 RepID=A0A1D2NAA9_ORCCI|nr:hypothetical protein Ocin01_04510 [Orchesella cincta]